MVLLKNHKSIGNTFLMLYYRCSFFLVATSFYYGLTFNWLSVWHDGGKCTPVGFSLINFLHIWNVEDLIPSGFFIWSAHDVQPGMMGPNKLRMRFRREQNHYIALNIDNITSRKVYETFRIFQWYHRVQRVENLGKRYVLSFVLKRCSFFCPTDFSLLAFSIWYLYYVFITFSRFGIIY